MRIAVFAGSAQLTGIPGSVPIPEPEDLPGLAAALELAERALAESGASAAVISGSGEWAFAAALASAKAPIPFAYAKAGDDQGRANHITRLAGQVLEDGADPQAAVQRLVAITTRG